jgi:hypothetical protein
MLLILAAPAIGLALGCNRSGVRDLAPAFNATAQPHAKSSTLRFAKPPRGAVVLFDGRDTSAWRHRDSKLPVAWRVVDGSLEVQPGAGDIMTAREFADCRLHVEFNLPLIPEAKSQARANSGVYLQGRYEIQILDSFHNETYPKGGVGAIYGQKDPDRYAIRPPGEWQSYDITFRAARFDQDGRVTQRPRMTVHHNDILIHDNVEIEDTTTAGLGGPVVARGPVLLQDHGNRVRFRNIWVLPLNLERMRPGSPLPESRVPAPPAAWD